MGYPALHGQFAVRVRHLFAVAELGDSTECNVEYRTAEGLAKRILVARLEDLGDTDITSAWQRCDLFADGETAYIEVPDGATGAVQHRCAKSDQGGDRRALGPAPASSSGRPRTDPDRAPYRGWEPFEDIDAGVFFGRDAVIARGLDVLRGMRFRYWRTMSGASRCLWCWVRRAAASRRFCAPG